MRLYWTRSIRPPADMDPNDNPAGVPPASVGPPDYSPGDPNGMEVTGETGPPRQPPPVAAPWDGWPAEWSTPAWGKVQTLSDIAWSCIDLNCRVLSTMPPYLAGAAPSLVADWTHNPQPATYSSWEEFAKQLFWDFLLVGETFVLATARYSTGWPARFHVVPPHLVEAEISGGVRRYSIGREDVTDDLLHLRYQGVGGRRPRPRPARGRGPQAGGGRNV